MCKQPSNQSYQNGCRCNECLVASRLARRKYRGNTSTEPELTVEADIAIEVLGQLRGAGMSWREIAERSGLKAETVGRIYRTKAAHCHIKTADAIYALQAEVELERPDLAQQWAL